jgi:hypothetical protein
MLCGSMRCSNKLRQKNGVARPLSYLLAPQVADAREDCLERYLERLRQVRKETRAPGSGWNTFRNIASLGAGRPGYQPVQNRLKQTRILAAIPELSEGPPVPEQGPSIRGGRRGADRGGAVYAVLDPALFRGASRYPIRLLGSVEMVGFAEHEKSAPSRFANVR